MAKREVAGISELDVVRVKSRYKASRVGCYTGSEVGVSSVIALPLGIVPGPICI